ncbi:YifB family Mg chelatase-like AAA ATPase [Nocardioides rotundus]|uniref:YifB family Mg chelatase-like AAA ATPase n=1 Tax=Nocardioides rotundus TaxID=1774216 RepID=UPI001CBBB386|nr:YifB family Mg chelatase-like AAA ATPase [Nocardioides rotundus]UAL28824.1 YifB family Mg chelatase-like AAA ATPase [Nocardioides rotundus]
MSGVATSRSISLQGAVGHLVDVQVDVSPGSVGATIVGRADVTLNEARERCRMAITNEHLTWPATRRVTILLSPADLAKRGTHFDLAIAVTVLAASEQVEADALRDTVLIGELTLDGRLRSVPGVLPMVMAASAAGVRRVFVPEPQAREAAMVPGMAVFGMRSLGQVVAELKGVEVPEAPEVAPMSGTRLLSWRGDARRDEVDLADLHGLDDARFALQVAAAGGHHLMLEGPKGSGKTSLVERLPGILPDLSAEERLELTAIHSLAGALEPGDGLLRRPPYCAPHHSASAASLLGGGSGRVRPGELSRAHGGVLFLDELPFFHTDVLEALRQPMESGEVTIARGEETATFPARTMLVVAANPCVCGNYGTGMQHRCTCTEQQRRTYRARLSGPLIDRIDITRHVVAARPAPEDVPWGSPAATTAEVRAVVEAARERQSRRWAGRSWRLNAHAPGPVLSREFPLPAPARGVVDEEVYAGRLSRRGATRVHRMAWTLADLSAADAPTAEHVTAALALRGGDPLPLSALDLEVAG